LAVAKKHVGRFGRKGQNGSLLSAFADSMRNELGFRNRLFPDECSSHDPKNGPTPLIPIEVPRLLIIVITLIDSRKRKEITIAIPTVYVN